MKHELIFKDLKTVCKCGKFSIDHDGEITILECQKLWDEHLKTGKEIRKEKRYGKTA